MARGPLMLRLARWHIWLGWLVGMPLLLWTASGLFMALRPIEEVRGDALRLKPPAQTIPAGAALLARIGAVDGVTEVTQRMEGGALIAVYTFADGRQRRYSPTPQAAEQSLLSEADARAIVARAIRGGNNVVRVRSFDAAHAPGDFRKPVAVWHVSLADGTHVYVGRSSGRIEAVRTRWWRIYDFMWGLHIMDLQTREDTSSPVLIAFAALALVGSILGTALLFRRRKARR